MGPGNWFLQKQATLACQCHILASSGSSLTPPTSSQEKVLNLEGRWLVIYGSRGAGEFEVWISGSSFSSWGWLVIQLVGPNKAN